MLSQIIQRQIPIGSTVVFALKDGREISGVLVEIGRDHVTLDNAGESVTILVEMIGTWRVPKDAESETREQTPVPKPTPAPMLLHFRQFCLTAIYGSRQSVKVPNMAAFSPKISHKP